MTINEKIKIVPLEQISQSQWLPLWQAYQEFYKTKLNEELNNFTWQRLTNPGFNQMYGFAAMLGQQVVGIVHVVEHDSCWTLRPYAYLQDLFTGKEYRGQGVARGLIEHIYQVAQQRNCERVYWLTQESNHQAQVLYNKVARKTEFIQYRMD